MDAMLAVERRRPAADKLWRKALDRSQAMWWVTERLSLNPRMDFHSATKMAHESGIRYFKAIRNTC
jgi:hypothetical protein